MDLTACIGVSQDYSFVISESLSMTKYLQKLSEFHDRAGFDFTEQFLEGGFTTALVNSGINWESGIVPQKGSTANLTVVLTEESVGIGKKRFLHLSFTISASDGISGTGTSKRVIQPVEYYKKKGRKPL